MNKLSIKEAAKAALRQSESAKRDLSEKTISAIADAIAEAIRRYDELRQD